MKIEPRPRPLDAILSELVDCGLLCSDFYLTRKKQRTHIKAIYPPNDRIPLSSWYFVASWDEEGPDRADTPISFAEAEAIIKNMHELHGGKI